MSNDENFNYYVSIGHLKYITKDFNPFRIVNRALYGTDYCPDDVSLKPIIPKKPGMTFNSLGAKYETYLIKGGLWI